MNNESNELLAASRLKNLVDAWNQSSFEAYSRDFTQYLVDHYNPAYFARIRSQCGQWLSSQYLGCLNQGRHQVHLWRARFERSANDALFSLTLTGDGRISALLKRFSKV